MELHERTTLDVQVVHDNHSSRTFRLDQQKAFSASPYLSRLGRRAPNHLITLHNVHPIVFGLFDFWLRRRQSSRWSIGPNLETYQEEPWLSNTAAAYVLAQRLEAKNFSRFCFEKFIQNCALAPFGPWHYIEDQLQPDAPLRRFSNHWVVWNASILRERDHEYVGLIALESLSMVDEYTGDPRNIDPEHWYTAGCGDSIAPRCFHNPRHRQVCTEERIRLERPLPEEWGHSEEQTYHHLGGIPMPQLPSLPLPLPMQPPQPIQLPQMPQLPPLQSFPRPMPPRSLSPSFGPSQRYRTDPTLRGGGLLLRMIRVLLTLCSLGCFVICFSLCIVLLMRDDHGVNWKTITYTMFCIVFGILFSIFPWVPEILPLYFWFAVGDGIALAVGSSRCSQGSSADICHMVKALTVFVWFTVPISALLFAESLYRKSSI